MNHETTRLKTLVKHVQGLHLRKDRKKVLYNGRFQHVRALSEKRGFLRFRTGGCVGPVIGGKKAGEQNVHYHVVAKELARATTRKPSIRLDGNSFFSLCVCNLGSVCNGFVCCV